MKMMKASLFFALALLAPCANASDPVSKIVKLLQGLSDKVEKEGETEEDLFNKYSCWAQDSVDEKREAIAKASEEITALNARIAEIESEAGKSQLDIERVEKNIEDNALLVERAEAKREQEGAVAEKAIADLKEANEGLESVLAKLNDEDKQAALVSLRGGQSGREQMLKRAADAKKAIAVTQKYLNAGDAAFVRSLFEHGQPSKDDLKKIHDMGDDMTEKKATSREAAVIDVVDKMKGDFDKNYEESKAAEAKAKKDHVALIAEKAEEKQNSEEELKMLREDTARRDYDKNKAETEIEALTDQKEIDDATINKLEAALGKKTEEWKARTKVRQDELAALSSATAMLSDPEKTANFRKAYSSADSFLQEGSSSSRDVRISASQALNKAGHVGGNVQVLALAAKLSSSGANFTGVLTEIDKMIKVLADEEDDDKEKKENCESELDENTEKKATLTTALQTAGENIESLNEDISAAEKKFDEYTAKVARLEQETGKASVQRQNEHEEYLENRQVDQAAKALLIEATEVVKGFFEPGDSALVQVSQREPIDKDAPETWENPEYEGSKDAGGSIIEAMNQAQEDLKADMDKAALCEKNAIAMYKDAMESFKEEKNILETKLIVQQEADKAKHEENLAGQTETNSTKTEAMAMLKKQMADLKPGCDFYVDNYDKRKANREEEEKGLVRAKEIMTKYDQKE